MHTVFERTLAALAIGMALSLPVAAGPMRLLVLTGQNNHDWQATTPILVAQLERGGQFNTDITETPETLTAEQLAAYDVVVSNWNAWGDAAVKDWPEAARSALLEFVRGGKGHVSVHAGSSSFYDWPEYHEMAITAWNLDTTGHGRQHTFQVQPTAAKHPITEGMEPFYTFDELWHGVPVAPGAEVLATAYSAEEMGGTGKDEPILFARTYGQGRSVNLLLGHHAQAMETPGFGVLVERAAQWAATGAVATPRPAVDWEQSAGHLALHANGEVLWRLHFGKSVDKPFFHPLNLADGPTLTWDAPEDHPWHHGLWFSWKFIDGVNFWEEDRETGRAPGRTTWDRPAIETEPDGRARVRFSLRYEPEPGQMVMTEERTLVVSPPDWLGGYHIDWTSHFTAGSEPVVLDRTPIEGEPDGKSWGGYAGLSIRFAPLTDARMAAEDGAVELGEPSGSHVADAMDYSGLFGGTPAGMAVFQYPDNPLRPTPWYLIANPAVPFHYYSPAVLYRSARTLAPGETLTLRYRIVVHPGRWDAAELAGRLRELHGGHPGGE